MPRASVIAKNYAKALFVATKKNNSLDKIALELEEFRKNFNSSFAHELQNPVISKSELELVMEEITKKLALSKITCDFFMAVARNRRLSMFPEIHSEFCHLVKKYKNILEVEVIFASKPSKSHFEQIKSLVEKRHVGKIIEIKETFNAKILGGFQVKIGSDIIDVSLKNQLFNLEKQLNEAIQ
ncbi:MAG: ATP synthase F1 subunit delta [Rickettsiales bacterium]|nr:ATP synthase F1 subunit delta [Rickettsiales bacterium]